MAADLTLVQLFRDFPDEDSARRYFEEIRWPNGPECPHCGNAVQKRIYRIEPNPAKKIRAGLYKCAECGKQFTVTVGTIMEDSHVPLHKWLIGFYLMAASKTQVAALQLQRQLEIGSYRTAWFMCQRIRFALVEGNPVAKLTGTVEADETYVGGVAKGHARKPDNKTVVMSLVQRGGVVRSQVVPTASAMIAAKVLGENVDPSAHLNTDESPIYKKVGRTFASHDVVTHKDEEYVRKDKLTGRIATTNSAEGFFGNAKRSIDGTHHMVSPKHLPLYLAEIDHKYNTRKMSDGARTVNGIKRIVGKRLTYKTPVGR